MSEAEFFEYLSITNYSNVVLNNVRIFKDGENISDGDHKVKVFDSNRISIPFVYAPGSNYEIRFNNECVPFEFNENKNHNSIVILSAHKSKLLKTGKKCYIFNDGGLYKKYDWPGPGPSENVTYYGLESELSSEDKMSIWDRILETDFNFILLVIWFIFLIFSILIMFAIVINGPK